MIPRPPSTRLPTTPVVPGSFAPKTPSRKSSPTGRNAPPLNASWKFSAKPSNASRSRGSRRALITTAWRKLLRGFSWRIQRKGAKAQRRKGAKLTQPTRTRVVGSLRSSNSDAQRRLAMVIQTLAVLSLNIVSFREDFYKEARKPGTEERNPAFLTSWLPYSIVRVPLVAAEAAPILALKRFR